MKYFHYKTLSELQQEAEALPCPNIRFVADPQKVTGLLARKVTVAGRQVGNSMCIHPMEGCDGELDGTPGELTTRRYVRFAEGGAKLLWFEATAVRPDGRANTRQLWLHEGNVTAYRELVELIHSRHKALWGTTDDLLMPCLLYTSDAADE